MDDIDITDGIVLVDKPAHMTSFGVVARVRRQLTARLKSKIEAQKQEKAQTVDFTGFRPSVPSSKVKVGHTGTLDPFATGLMILVVGTECKNAGNYSKLDKTYEATIRLGETSTTGDPEGDLTPFPRTVLGKGVPKRQEVEVVLKQFIGDIQQMPPAFSAIKVNGQRAYKLARQGEVVKIPARTITIYSLELLEYAYPELKIRARVSSGTYIRTLAEDIGATLGTGAYCSQLRRCSIAAYNVTDAIAVHD